MTYWRIRVNPVKNGEYYVYFKTDLPLVQKQIPGAAVRAGDLLDVFKPCVDEVVEITADEYFEHMWE